LPTCCNVRARAGYETLSGPFDYFAKHSASLLGPPAKSFHHGWYEFRWAVFEPKTIFVDLRLSILLCRVIYFDIPVLERTGYCEINGCGPAIEESRNINVGWAAAR